MDLFSLDSETAKNIGLSGLGLGLLGVLVVLKFVKSVVSKILLLAVFGALTYFSFTQRDSLSVCIAKLEATSASDIAKTTCTFFGQEISLRGINK